MAQDLIADPKTGKNVATMSGGEVFRDDKEGAKIATLLNDNVYDLNGNLVGRVEGRHVIEASPGSFTKLLEGES